MGSAKKALGKIMGFSSKKAALITMMNQPTDAQRVANGEGRMLNGKYQAFSAEDKAHYDAAQANRNAEYKDISEGSALGQYFGNNSLLESIRKKRDAVRSTLLGGNPSNLGG